MYRRGNGETAENSTEARRIAPFQDPNTVTAGSIDPPTLPAVRSTFPKVVWWSVPAHGCKHSGLSPQVRGTAIARNLYVIPSTSPPRMRGTWRLQPISRRLQFAGFHDKAIRPHFFIYSSRIRSQGRQEERPGGKEGV